MRRNPSRDLESYAVAVEKMRTDMIFDEDLTSALDPVAEQEFIAATSFLDLAQRSLMKAQLHQVRSIADRGRSR